MRPDRPRSAARHALALAALAVALAAVPARAIPSCATRPGWIKIQTPHFVLVSNDEPGNAVADARVLEHLAGTLDRRGGRLGDSSGTRAVVYALAGPTCFGAFRPAVHGHPVELLGFFVHDPFSRAIAFETGTLSGDFRVVAHEYVHVVVHARLDGLPVCLNEGLAEYFSTFREAGGRAQYGHPLPGHLEWLHTHPLLDMDSLFAVTYAADIYHEGPRRGTVYAESWALVHYLMSTDERRDRFETLLGLLAAGARPREAFARAFPDESWDGMPALLRAYVDRPTFGYREVEAPPRADTLQVVAMRPAAVLDALGDLMRLQQGRESEDSDPYYRAALAADSTDAMALATLGWLAEERKHPDQAEALFRRALALAPDHAGVNFIAGYSAVWRWITGVLGAYDTRVFPPVLLLARERLARCLAHDPANAEALAAYGRTFLFEQLPSPEGAEALGRALQALPTRTDIAIALVKVLANDGDLDQACDLYAGRIRHHAAPFDRASVADHVRWAAFMKAEGLRKQRRDAEADSLEEHVDRALADPEHPAAPWRVRRSGTHPFGEADPGYADLQRAQACIRDQRLDEAQRWLQRAEVSARRADLRAIVHGSQGMLDQQLRLRSALRLANAGRNGEARSILTALLGESLTPAQREYAEKLLKRVTPPAMR